MKTYNYNGLNVYLKATSYANNGSLAVQMLSGDDNEFYDVITVNLGSFLQTEQLAFVDDNNLPGIGQWLEANGIASPTGFYQTSGFCKYPLYEFHL